MKYVRITDNCALPSLSEMMPFRCVVVIEAGVGMERQKEISAWLVECGCLYMMAWGEACGSWDTSVDLANLEHFGFGDIPEESFVMTTWHDDETLSEVFWYSKHCAFHSTIDLKNTVVLHLSEEDKGKQFLSGYENA